MQLSAVQSKSIVRRVIRVACRCLSMANILFWKLTEKYCFTIVRVRIATRYKAQLAYSRKSCETILIIEHLKEVFHSICPALFRDGAFSCRHELPRALTGLAGCSGQSCRAPSRDLRDVQVIISIFAHTGPRAEKAVCRRYAGKPTPRRRVGRLVCAAKTRARKAVRLAGSLPSLWGKGYGENPLARR